MGWAYEAMMDMTGAPCQSLQFSSPDIAASIKNGSFFHRLLEMDREGYLLSASTPGEDTFSMSEDGKKDVSFGLVPGHAYALIALKELSNGAQIACVSPSDFYSMINIDHCRFATLGAAWNGLEIGVIIHPYGLLQSNKNLVHNSLNLKMMELFGWRFKIWCNISCVSTSVRYVS